MFTTSQCISSQNHKVSNQKLLKCEFISPQNTLLLHWQVLGWIWIILWNLVSSCSVSPSAVKPYFIALRFYREGIKVYFLSQSCDIINHSGDDTVYVFIKCFWISKDIYYGVIAPIQELPNIRNIFEIIIIRTGISNKKLPMDFWESKLHSEVLKSFPEVKKLWALFCLGRISNVKSNTEFYTST